MTWPRYSPETFLKLPIFVMIRPFPSSSRVLAASMRMEGQQAPGAAASARNDVEDGGRGLSWFARNGGTPGEESPRPPLRQAGRAPASCWPLRGYREGVWRTDGRRCGKECV